MTLPTHPVELAQDLVCVPNGKVPAYLLEQIGLAGRLTAAAARAWRALWLMGQEAGWSLTYTYGGTYRSFDQQVTLFYQRWSPAPIAGRPTVAYNGGLWWLKPHVARAAVPGTSNHGTGVAVDLALGAGPDTAQPISPAIEWLVDVCPSLGWFWEDQSEPWHVNYCFGDDVPTTVLSVEADYL